MNEYKQLLTAVQDLLCELRINPDELNIMAKGVSPNYPGSAIEDSTCKVQISKKVAGKLVLAGVTNK